MTLFPGLPRWAGIRKVKPIWILLKQERVSGSGISLAMCKSAPSSSTPPLCFLKARCPSCHPTNSVKAKSHANVQQKTHCGKIRDKNSPSLAFSNSSSYFLRRSSRSRFCFSASSRCCRSFSSWTLDTQTRRHCYFSSRTLAETDTVTSARFCVFFWTYTVFPAVCWLLESTVKYDSYAAKLIQYIIITDLTNQVKPIKAHSWQTQVSLEMASPNNHTITRLGNQSIKHDSTKLGMHQKRWYNSK